LLIGQADLDSDHGSHDTQRRGDMVARCLVAW
jgi:hypothetical protein